MEVQVGGECARVCMCMSVCGGSRWPFSSERPEGLSSTKVRREWVWVGPCKCRSRGGSSRNVPPAGVFSSWVGVRME